MPRLLLWLIVLATLGVGTPIVAMLLDRAMGPWAATGIEHDGSTTTIAFDRNQQRPDWVALPPGASIVQASRVVNAKQRRDVYLMSLSTSARMPDIRDFYRDRLSHAGFAVTDLGTGAMNARTAAFLGVADMLSASRSTDGEQIAVTIRTPEGLFNSTLVELKWGWFGSPPAKNAHA